VCDPLGQDRKIDQELRQGRGVLGHPRGGSRCCRAQAVTHRCGVSRAAHRPNRVPSHLRPCRAVHRGACGGGEAGAREARRAASESAPVARRVLALESWPVLFVCGAHHVDPFGDFLRANGHHSPRTLPKVAVGRTRPAGGLVHQPSRHPGPEPHQPVECVVGLRGRPVLQARSPLAGSSGTTPMLHSTSDAASAQVRDVPRMTI
jgi:hypothetical protein